MSEELLPCPFCGGEASMQITTLDDDEVECKFCGAEAPLISWNTRPDPAVTPEQAARVLLEDGDAFVKMEWAFSMADDDWFNPNITHTDGMDYSVSMLTAALRAIAEQ